MEDVDVLVVVPERPQRLADLAEPGGVRLVGGRPGLAALVLVYWVSLRGLLVLRRRSSASRSTWRRTPRRRRARGGRTRVRRRRTAERSSGRRYAERAAGAGAPEPDQHAEGRQHVERAPLGADRQPEDPGDQPPGRHSSPDRPPAGRPAPRAPAGQPVAEPLPVGDQQCTAHSMKNARKMSSSASRDSTNWSPSKHSSRPADQPSSVEPVSRRTSRPITSTIREPTTAEAIRQPRGPARRGLLAEPRSATCRPRGGRSSTGRPARAR